ncbi:exonuclease mut-7 homolog isoform X2 [Hydractinia symbiolongicarpus]|uniref:exonuclease mut-7 homolog isoform X2 n=1 Tax=Hydractinia symbiolongicarpus TaxID=13093 RepID=UPI00254F6005|nr:exonuclease mut-7 homolog isoform X2 [Hydractinia symbiolongicarpus]
MPFDTGVPPPKSKYSYADLGFNVCPNNDSDDDYDNDDDEWICSSNGDNLLEKMKNCHVEDQDSIKCLVPSKRIIRLSAQDWLDKIEDKYFDERDDLVRQTVQTALDNTDDCYSFVLHVIHKAFFDLFSKRLPITFLALDEFSIWLELKKQNGEHLPQPLYSHKRQALEFVCRGGYNYLDKINATFQLDQDDNTSLADVIQLDNLKCKKLKETVIIIYTLKLQHQFEQEEVMLPLLASDLIQVLETYIGDDEYLQRDYVSFLNKLCGMKESDIQKMIVEKDLKVKDSSKLQHKTLTKIAEKAVKRYNLSPNEFPKIFEAKNIASLLYLIRMRMKEENTNGSASVIMKWDNLIETAVSGKPFLQMQLILKFYEMDLLEYAINWAIRLKLHPKNLPVEVRQELSQFSREFERNMSLENETNMSLEDESSEQKMEDDIRGSNCGTEDWEAEIEAGTPRSAFSFSQGFVSEEDVLQEEYYNLKLSKDNIHMIDTAEKLNKIMPILFVSGQIIGFDAEWKPTMCRAGEQDRVSILQVATQTDVYIIDLFTLYVVHGSEGVLEQFFFKFFTSTQVVKVGYGITGDLKILMGMYLCVKDFILHSHNLVDLCEISGKITSHPQVAPYLYAAKKAALDEKGLSLLVNRTLGKRLNKTFQVSDWEKRPLSHQQIEYAALDAYCLVEVYALLQRVVKETKIDVNLTENVKLKWLKPKRYENKRKDKYEKRTDKEKIPEIKSIFKGPPRPSTSLKVICDTMMQGLGRQLRTCGVDTIILSNDQDHSTAIQISHKENRAILTQGKPFFMLRGHVREGMCMWVPEAPLKEQVKMVFTKYNVALKSKDILTRCSMCNFEGFEKVPSEELKQAYDLKFDIGECKMPETQATPSGLVNLSNFTLYNGVEIQLDFLSTKKGSVEQLFQKVDQFYICRNCGKLFWEGSHHTAVRNNFAELIDKREVDENYYGAPG